MGFLEGIGNFMSDVADHIQEGSAEKNRILKEICDYNFKYGNICGKIEVAGTESKVEVKETHSEQKKNFSRKESAINYLKALGFTRLSRYSDDDWCNGAMVATIMVNFSTPLASYDVVIS